MSKPEISVRRVQRHQNLAFTNALAQYEADLASNDINQQKNALKKYLLEIVRNDWNFQWPAKSFAADINSSTPETNEGTDGDSNNISHEEWREREDWFSNASDILDDSPQDISIFPSAADNPKYSRSPSEDSDIDEEALKKSFYAFKLKQKQLLEEELSWNDGLRCFMARRDAWTCARITKKQEFSGLHEKFNNNLSNKLGNESKEKDKKIQFKEVVEVPVGPPLIPVENPVRKSIDPRAYNTIYDKLIMNSFTPACPINLKDLTQICVQGWKRFGGWPPSPKGSEKSQIKKAKKKALANLFLPNEPDESSVYIREERTTKAVMHRRRDIAQDKEGKDNEIKRKSIGSCFNRILGRGV